VPLEDLAERLSLQDASVSATVLLKVRAQRASEVTWVEAILASFLAAPTDWLAHLIGPRSSPG
jgi:hypothetical protein